TLSTEARGVVRACDAPLFLAKNPKSGEARFDIKSWITNQRDRLRRDMNRALREARILSRVVRHRNAPWYVKCVGACPVLYIFSPVQLIPSFIPVIGQMDDLFILWAGTKIVRRLTPAWVLAECEAQVELRARMKASKSASQPKQVYNAIATQQAD